MTAWYVGKLCSQCLGTLRAQDEVVACTKCRTPYHAKCWSQLRACLTSRCGGTESIPADAPATPAPVVAAPAMPAPAPVPLPASPPPPAAVTPPAPAAAPIIPETPLVVATATALPVTVSAPRAPQRPAVSASDAPPAPPLDAAVEALLDEYYTLLVDDKYEAAKAKLTKIKTVAGEHPRVMEAEGDAALAQKQYGEARELYKTAMVADPTREDVEEKYAQTLVKLEEPGLMLRLGPSTDDDESLWYVRIKRPVWASALMSGVLPGLGQWFNGDWLKGAVLLFVSAIASLWGLYPVYTFLGQESNQHHYFSNQQMIDKLVQLTTSGTALFWNLLLLGLWTYSIVDAILIARATNKRY